MHHGSAVAYLFSTCWTPAPPNSYCFCYCNSNNKCASNALNPSVMTIPMNMCMFCVVLLHLMEICTWNGPIKIMWSCSARRGTWKTEEQGVAVADRIVVNCAPSLPLLQHISIGVFCGVSLCRTKLLEEVRMKMQQIAKVVRIVDQNVMVEHIAVM